MKFVIAVVMLGLAIAQASVLPWGVPGIWGPSVLGHGGPVLSHGHTVVGPHLPLASVWGSHLAPAHLPAAVQVAGYPLAHHIPAAVHVAAHSVQHIPAAVHVSPVVPHGHEGVYVAKTRGSVHTAPLAGHIASASSINLAPAPGTH